MAMATHDHLVTWTKQHPDDESIKTQVVDVDVDVDVKLV